MILIKNMHNVKRLFISIYFNTCTSLVKKKKKKKKKKIRLSLVFVWGLVQGAYFPLLKVGRKEGTFEF